MMFVLAALMMNSFPSAVAPNDIINATLFVNSTATNIMYVVFVFWMSFSITFHPYSSQCFFRPIAINMFSVAQLTEVTQPFIDTLIIFTQLTGLDSVSIRLTSAPWPPTSSLLIFQVWSFSSSVKYYYVCADCVGSFCCHHRPVVYSWHIRSVCGLGTSSQIETRTNHIWSQVLFSLFNFLTFFSFKVSMWSFIFTVRSLIGLRPTPGIF